MPTQITVDITKEIINEITAATKQLLIASKLGNSEMFKSIEWTYRNDAFMLIANDYFQWVNSGRRPRARKVPVTALLKWMKKKNIVPQKGQTYNQVAFAIQNAIYKQGIKSRNYVNPIIGVTLDILEVFIADQLSVKTADSIAAEMTFTLGHA